MEQIKIENFLVIKEATFKINKLNVIIGPQANGKSILVKLSYFFKKLINTVFLNSIKDSENVQELIESGKVLFESYFPSYICKNTNFNISYENKHFLIEINNSTDNNFNLIFCDNFLELKRDMENDYKKFLKKNKKDNNSLLFNLMSFQDFKSIFFKKNKTNECIQKLLVNTIFIPASRSYFISLQKNIFSFLSKDIDIDIFIKEFGSYYERSKNIYSEIEIYKKFNRINVDEFKKLMDMILKGEFVHKDNKDWIQTKDSLISLSDASSGQQESLPMLMVLYTQLILGNKNINYIEEPEAHLFPNSQKYIIYIIALLYNFNNVNFITTHSPYVLTAINNLIFAYDVMKNKGEDLVSEIISKNLTINFDDVAAYTIENGILTSIKDEDTRLIGMNIIDSVSDDFSEEFDKLLKLSIYNDF